MQFYSEANWGIWPFALWDIFVILWSLPLQSYVENYVVAAAVFISKSLALQSSSECAVVQSYATMFSISSRSLG